MTTLTPDQRVLVVVAHPDDEAIFFAGLIAALRARAIEVDVLCATGRFENHALTGVRRREFERSCRRLDAGPILLDLEDRWGALLDQSALVQALEGRAGDHERVYTHGVWGEYGHPHHSQVCAVVHRVFGDAVRCLAGPFDVVERYQLDPRRLAEKRERMRAVYPSQRFAWDWPSRDECYARLDLACVEFFLPIALRHPMLGPPIAVDRSPSDPAAFSALLRRCRDAFAPSAPAAAELENIPAGVWRPTRTRRHRALCAHLDQPAHSTAFSK